MSATGSAVAQIRKESSRRRFTPERVSLHDTDTVSVADLVPGDTFVAHGRVYVALSARLESGALHAHPFSDRSALETLALSDDDEVLVFL